jgi:hypothetical protein
MFELKAGTVLVLVQSTGHRQYKARKTTLLNKEEVIDAVAVHNKRDDVEDWMIPYVRNGHAVIRHQGHIALAPANQLKYLD